jgi:hypothetical protein
VLTHYFRRLSQCLLLLCEYLLAMLVPNISVAFSVLGSTVAVLIGASQD